MILSPEEQAPSHYSCSVLTFDGATSVSPFFAFRMRIVSVDGSDLLVIWTSQGDHDSDLIP